MTTPGAAAKAAAKAGSGGVTLVITGPGLLTAQQLARLARVPGTVFWSARTGRRWPRSRPPSRCAARLPSGRCHPAAA